MQGFPRNREVIPHESVRIHQKKYRKYGGKLPCSKRALKTEQNALGLGLKCTPTIRKSVIVFMQDRNIILASTILWRATRPRHRKHVLFLPVRPNPNYRNARSDSMRTNVRNKRLLYRGIEFAVAGPPLPLYVLYMYMHLRGTGWNAHSSLLPCKNMHIM